MTWTHTSRGRALDLLDPRAEDIDLDEIAMALGNQCRYAGCVQGFYSVAEHSWLISHWLGDQGEPVEVQLGGLLHDAAEAYTGDITWPMQSVLWGDDEAGRVVRQRYRLVQYMLDDLIARAAGLGDEGASWLHDEAVRRADLRILLDERANLLGGPPPRPWPVESEMGLTRLGVDIRCLPPEEAAESWRHRLAELRSRVAAG